MNYEKRNSETFNCSILGAYPLLSNICSYQWYVYGSSVILFTILVLYNYICSYVPTYNGCLVYGPDDFQIWM